MKIYKLPLLILFSFLIISCNDWLDVKPNNQINEDKLFETGEGYRTAINGIYQQLSEGSLYGRELSWGALSVLSQHYNLDKQKSDTYSHIGAYDYTYPGVKQLIEGIWRKSYNSIANCNNLIKNIDAESPEKFKLKEIEKDLILGEGYALRGMIHFDLLRLFAPSPYMNTKASFIPYYDEFPTIVKPNLSVKETLDKIIIDLKKAKDLVASYDTIPDKLNVFKSLAKRLSSGDYTGDGAFFSYRGTRLNYYAITSLLARVYMYAGESENAYKEAKEVIDANIFKFTSEYDLSVSTRRRNRKLTDDLILSFYNKELTEIFKPFYGDYGYLVIKNLTKVFAGDEDDYRKKRLIVRSPYNTYISLKYLETSDDNLNRTYGPLIPMIRLSELYYIAGECIFDENPEEATTLLKQLRIKRGCKSPLPIISNKTQYIDALVTDACREFIGEGQLFFMYKRLNLPVRDGNGLLILDDKFTFPIPNSQKINF